VNVFYRSVFRGWQNSYLQYQAGSLNEDIWLAELSFLQGVLGNDQGMRLHWQLEQDLYTKSFRELISGFLESAH
jgi:hypothetical protein